VESGCSAKDDWNNNLETNLDRVHDNGSERTIWAV
jgi:hypothetical protein